MLLNITTTHQPTTDLGYLLHKHPDKMHTLKLPMGKAHVFFSELSEEQATASLLLELDPMALAKMRNMTSSRGFALGQYVNDRPYVASSFMSGAIAKAYSSAMNGNCKNNPTLVETKMSLEVNIPVLHSPNGGERLIRNLFEPLGYLVTTTCHRLDDEFTHWGDSDYFAVNLSHTITLQQLLSHLYILFPVLDGRQHYYISWNEVKNLLNKGEGWLATHPKKEQITKQYLSKVRSLSIHALTEMQDGALPSEHVANKPIQQGVKTSLNHQRLSLVLKMLKDSGAKKVLDLGCGDGNLIQMLLKEKQFEKIVGIDVSHRELLKCKKKLLWEEMVPWQKNRVQLFQSSIVYKDKRLEGFDAAALVEVIEHLEPHQLVTFEKVVFDFARPKTILVTTPNSAYNIRYENIKSNGFRHADHRFEWTRSEFESWAHRTAESYQYKVQFLPIGEVDSELGSPSQLAIFEYGN